MTYKVCLIQKNLAAMQATIEKARATGKYVGHEAAWDKLVVELLERNTALPEQHIAHNRSYVESRYPSIKGRLGEVKALLEQKSLGEKEYQHIALAAQLVEKVVAAVDADYADLSVANIQYRGTWSAAPLVSNPALLSRFNDQRERSINVGKAVHAMVQRIDEYGVRIQEFAKQALQRQKGAAADSAEFSRTTAEIEARMKTMREKIGELHFKQSRPIASFDGWSDKKAWTNAEKTEAKQKIAALVGARKEASGHCKTMLTLYEGLEKRAKSAPAALKAVAAAALKKAKPYVAEAEKEAAVFKKEAAAAEATYKKMGG